MAQLLIPPPPENARISQILPTVKCSTCNQPVPISELGDHICPPAPVVKPPMSPRSTASILSQKYHSLVSRPSTPQAQSHSPSKPSISTPPARQSTPVAPLRVNSPNPPSQPQAPRTRSASSVSSLGVRDQHSRPERTPSPLSKGSVSNSPKVAFPSSPGPTSPQRAQRTPSPLATRPPQSGGPPRVSTPLSAGRNPSEPLHPVSPASAPRLNPDPAVRGPNYSAPTPPNIRAPRPRAPSSASLKHGVPPVRQPAQSSPVPPLQLSRNSNAVPLSPPSSTPRPRATTNIGSLPPINTSPDVIYTTTGSHAGPPHPNFDPRLRAPPGSPFSPYRTMSPALGPGMSPIQGPFSPIIEVDTKTGGEAGMAGVGRRGFAAAARAAMFAQSLGTPPMNGPMNVGIGPGMALSPNSPEERAMLATMDAVQGMDGRRPNAPKFLDINSLRNYANTPPLSPNSGSSHSSHSPLSAPPISPDNDGRTSVTPTPPAIASRTPSPSGLRINGVQTPTPEPPKSPLPQLPATPSTPSSIRLPFFEKFKDRHPSVDITPPAPEPASADPSPLSPSSSESSFGGLAYADSTDGEDEDAPISVSATEIPRQPSPANTIKPSDITPETKPNGKVTGKVRFPSMSPSSKKSESAYSSSSSTSAPSPRLPQRSLSASTTTSSYSIRSAAKSTGALDRAMETLFEEDPTSPTSNSGPSMFQLADGHNRDSKPPKLPVRSHTSPTLGGGRPDSRHVGKRKEPKVRVCVKCERQIDDGRWIQMEGGSVLCDKCWKNMYLPKCRRCTKAIEKHAVSSSDGQLKGKYHRECFSCHTCQKPFPDKSFYVFDGKPFCMYHYHEANESLCAAATCGQPIEGPCAVSHAGDRYHPEHLLCEYARCTEKLVEYWEVDGRMLCDRHAQHVMRETGEEEEDEEGDNEDGEKDTSARAKKRVTRFIDLAAMNANGGGGSDLR